jgi:hypothetical protein
MFDLYDSFSPDCCTKHGQARRSPQRWAFVLVGVIFVEKRTVAKAIKTRGKSRKSLYDDHMPLAKENFTILGIGILTIVVGYVAMLEGSVEGFLPLVAAPVLLVIGYCVLIPLGIIYRRNLFARKGIESVAKPEHQA